MLYEEVKKNKVLQDCAYIFFKNSSNKNTSYNEALDAAFKAIEIRVKNGIYFSKLWNSSDVIWMTRIIRKPDMSFSILWRKERNPALRNFLLIPYSGTENLSTRKFIRWMKSLIPSVWISHKKTVSM